jgi:hypothetical protein
MKFMQNLTVCVKLLSSFDIHQTTLFHHLYFPLVFYAKNHSQEQAFLGKKGFFINLVY